MLGRYELLRPLARGGMAELFLARRRAPGGVEKRMVIKRIRRERANDPRFAAMFVREARLSMSLAHKNIVPVFDFGRVGDELFLVMEYVDGVDLATALARAVERDAPPAPIVVAFIGLEACQALEYAHQLAGLDGEPGGVIHRDVTPSNVLLSYSGEVKLLDFGIATSETPVGEETVVRGTPPYMAPEQARGEGLTARTDVFAVGLVLWEALAGRRAYAGKEPLEVLAAAARGEVPPLDPDRAPAGLRAIVERATRFQAEERFADARAMQLALDEYLVEARAGLERRGPAHQLLASWVSELFPERESGRSSGTVAVPDGPVATFLDDGEERVTHLFAGPPGGDGGATARSIATTIADTGGAQAIAGGERGLSRARSGRWMIAAAILIAAPTAILVATKLATSEEEAERVKSSPTVAPSGDSPAPRSETEKLKVAAPAKVATPASGPDAGPARLPSGSAAGPDPDRMSGGPERHGGVRSSAAPPIAVGPTPQPRPGRGAPPAQGARSNGTVRVSSSPWAQVRVVGRSERCRETPCSLVLPAGTHTLVLRNPVAQVGKSVVVDVTARETVTVRETLTAPR